MGGMNMEQTVKRFVKGSQCELKCISLAIPFIYSVIYSTRRFQHSSMRATLGINPLSYGFQLSTHKPGCTCKHIRVWG